MTQVILTPPWSKSDAQRALVLAECAHLGADALLKSAPPLPRDVLVLRGGLEELRKDKADIDCHDGGAPFRFLLAQAAVLPGRTVRFFGTQRLLERPHGPLVSALRDALGPWGFSIETPDAWPWVLKAPAHPERALSFEVAGAESSQFASSLLLAAARLVAQDGIPRSVEVRGALASQGYLSMTHEWLKKMGFVVEQPSAALTMVQGWSASPAVPRIPSDWSSLTYLLPMAWRAQALVSGVELNSGHPDEAVVSHLASVGIVLEAVEGGPLTAVRGVARGALEVDVSQCPDAAPALAAVACVVPGRSRFQKTGILRQKESDRLAGIVDLVRCVGGAADVVDETLHITPPTSPRAIVFDARDDHRMAMAAATLGVLAGVSLELTGREAVKKSFPGFWDELAKIHKIHQGGLAFFGS